MSTNITTAHREAFEAIRGSSFTNLTLFSCFVSGEPAAVIVSIDRADDEYTITPLFVDVDDPH